MAVIDRSVSQTLTFTQPRTKVKKKKAGQKPKQFGNRSNQFHPFNLKQ